MTVARTTRETDITIRLVLDGSGRASAKTGVGFYDHLLTALGHHGLFDLDIQATGDLEIDEHHTVEDVALVLGAAFNEALADRAAINRYGSAMVPMDESLAHGRRRRRRPPVRRDRPAVPRRAGRRAAAAADPARVRIVRADLGHDAAPDAAPAATTTTSRRRRSRRSARALRIACEIDPRRTRRGVHEGRRSDERRGRGARRAVPDRGRRLRRRQPRQHRPGPPGRRCGRRAGCASGGARGRRRARRARASAPPRRR